MNKKQVSENLSLIAKLLVVSGENHFKSKAFENASRMILQIPDFDELIKNKNLNKIKGIGKSIEKEIYDLVENDISTLLNELMASLPEGVIDILSLKGLGAKKVKILYEKLGISSVGELEYACNENRLMLLKGFGKKTQENILKSIKKFKERKMLMHLSEAEIIVKNILSVLQQSSFTDKIAVTGDYRRKVEIINRIEFVISLNNFDMFVEKFGKATELKTEYGFLRYIDTDIYNRRVRFFITNNVDFNKILFITTGSEKFLRNFNEIQEIRKEKEFFSRNNLNFIIPEAREDKIINVNPTEIIQFNDLQGVFHIHTTYSDGADTLENIVRYLVKRGFKYAGISDHSQSAFYANGLKEDDIKRQHEEIDILNEKYKPFKIFKGIESDILKNGSLDYSDKILEKFDFVIASVHSSFNLSEKDMTDRIIKAIENPYTTILGHPTGRLILFRDAYKLAIHEVLDSLKRYNKFVEINSHPYRLDLSWQNCMKASEKGIKFFITPDAHNLDGFDYLKYGICVARKALLKKTEIINTYDIIDVEKEIKNAWNS